MTAPSCLMWIEHKTYAGTMLIKTLFKLHIPPPTHHVNAILHIPPCFKTWHATASVIVRIYIETFQANQPHFFLEDSIPRLVTSLECKVKQASLKVSKSTK
jgi:hypothetical protein